MAVDDHDLDDLDFNDDEFDIPSFDFNDLDDPAAGRKPLERVTTGFLSGIKESALTPSTQRKFVQKVLPEGYGKAFDDVQELTSLGKQLYDNAASKLRPLERDVKKIARVVGKKTEKYLPDSWNKGLAKWTDEGESERLGKVSDQDAAAMEALAGVFGEGVEQQVDARAEDQANRRIDQFVGDVRHKDTLSVLGTMRSGMERLVSYQDTVAHRWRIKTLDLQARQLQVSNSQLETLVGFVKETKTQLDVVIKNTALPDFVKMHKNERARQMLLDKTLGKIGTSAKDFSANFTSQLKENLIGKAQSFSESVAQGVGMASTMVEATDGIPIDSVEEGGRFLGDQGLNSGIDMFGRRLGRLVGRIPGVERTGNNLSFLSDNKESLLKDKLSGWRDRGEFDEEGNKAGFLSSLRGGLAGVFLDAMPSMSAGQTYSNNLEGLSSEVAPYTSLTDRSITEIIPNLLTEILYEAEMIRSGEGGVERRIYDHETRTLKRQSTVDDRLRESVMPEDTAQNIQERLDKMMETFDPDQRLSEMTRGDLRKQMINTAVSGGGFNPADFFKSSMSTQMGDASTAEIRYFLENDWGYDSKGGFQSTDDTANRRNLLSEQFKGVKDTLPEYKEIVARLLPLYGPEPLRRMGLLEHKDGDDQFNVDAMVNFMGSGERVDSQAVEDLGGDQINVGGRSINVDAIDKLTEVVRENAYVPHKEAPVEQFKAVLKRIDDIDMAFDVNNDWLEKIYAALRNCCPPDGGGPSGPQGPQGPTRDRPPLAPYRPTQRVRGIERWSRFKGPAERWGTKLEDAVESGQQKARSLYDVGREKTLPMFTQVRENVGKVSLADVKERTLSSGLGKSVSQGMGAVQDRLQSAVDHYGPLANQQTDKVGVYLEELKAKMAAPDAELKDMLSESLSSLSETMGDLKGSLFEQTASLKDVFGDFKGNLAEQTQSLKGTLLDQAQTLKGTFGNLTATLIDRLPGLKRFIENDVLSDENKAQVLERVSPYVQTAKDKASNLLGQSETAKAYLKKQGGILQERTQDARRVVDQGVQRVGDQVTRMSDYRLENQPTLVSLGEAGQRFADGSRTLASSAGDYGASLLDQMPNFSEMRFTADSGTSADNDAKYTLNKLQEVSSQILKVVEGADIGQRAGSYFAELKSKTQDAFKQLRGDMSQDAPEYGGGSGGSGSGGGDRWDQAWDMLADLKRHMDAKTQDLLSGMSELSLGEGGAASGMGRRILNGAGSGLGAGLKGLGNAYGKYARGVGSLGAGIFSGSGRLLRGVGGGVGDRLRGMIGGRSKDQPITDIYHVDQESPLMLARDLAKGRYVTADENKPIRRITEIKGEIRDLETQNLVVTQDDLKDNKLYTLTQETPAASGKSFNLGKALFNYTTAPSRGLLGAAGKLFGVAKDQLNKPQDIYVKGENKPRLLAFVMKNGGYLNASDQSVISTIGDIKGEVVDLQGNIVLTHDDLKQGLVNARGKAIRTGAKGAGNLIGGAVGMLGDYYKGAFNLGRKVIGGAVKGVGRLFSRGDSSEDASGSGMGGEEHLDVLNQIRDILDDRLEKPIEGDLDGDGFREGGWRSKLFGKKKTPEAEAVSPDTPKADPSAGALGAGGIMGMLGGVLSKFTDSIGSVIGSVTDTISGLADATSLSGDLLERRQKRGARPKVKAKGGRLARLAKGALNVGRAVLPSAAAVGGVLSGVGGALATGAGWLAAGVGAVVSSPVLLTGAVIAGAAALGYYFYRRHVKRLRGPLHRLRLLQYGANVEEVDHRAMIMSLEEFLKDHTQLKEGQPPSLAKGIDPEELLKSVGVDADDKPQVETFLSWFQNRFKPVYLSHMGVLHGLDKNVSLQEVDSKLKDEFKLSYVKATMFGIGPQSPYQVTAHPFGEEHTAPSAGTVKAECDKIVSELAGKGSPSTPDTEDKVASAQTVPTPAPRPTTPMTPVVPEVDVQPKATHVPDLTSGDPRPGDRLGTEVPRTSTQRTSIPRITPQQKAEEEATRELSVEQEENLRRRRQQDRRRYELESQQGLFFKEVEGGVNRMINVLTDSYQIQSTISATLTELKTHLKEKDDERRQRDSAQVENPGSSDFSYLNRLMGSNKAERPAPSGGVDVSQ